MMAIKVDDASTFNRAFKQEIAVSEHHHNHDHTEPPSDLALRVQALESLLIETELVSPAELKIGKAAGPADESIQRRVLKADKIAEVIAKGSPAAMTNSAPPLYKSGDSVRAVNRHPMGHTREPRYVRGRVGVIHECRGTHVFPDRSAEGSKEGRHLYNVRFTTEALWGQSASGRNAVYVDLWEDYLEPV
jgi:nitrile hydratase